jgi:hypothetical protein
LFKTKILGFSFSSSFRGNGSQVPEVRRGVEIAIVKEQINYYESSWRNDLVYRFERFW